MASQEQSLLFHGDDYTIGMNSLYIRILINEYTANYFWVWVA